MYYKCTILNKSYNKFFGQENTLFMKLVQKLYKVFFKWIAPMTRGVTDKTYNWKKKGSGRREEEEEEMEERRGALILKEHCPFTNSLFRRLQV